MQRGTMGESGRCAPLCRLSSHALHSHSGERIAVTSKKKDQSAQYWLPAPVRPHFVGNTSGCRQLWTGRECIAAAPRSRHRCVEQGRVTRGAHKPAIEAAARSTPKAPLRRNSLRTMLQWQRCVCLRPACNLKPRAAPREHNAQQATGTMRAVSRLCEPSEQEAALSVWCVL